MSTSISETRTCPGCSSVFEIVGYYKGRRYCSQSCYWESKRGKPWLQVSDATRESRRQRMTGDRNPMWVSGDSDRERRNSSYKEWRVNVFKRDGFTCQRCGYFNGCGEKRRDLQAHHIARWVTDIDLRYSVGNGMTLCLPCHRKEHGKRVTS